MHDTKANECLPSARHAGHEDEPSRPRSRCLMYNASDLLDAGVGVRPRALDPTQVSGLKQLTRRLNERRQWPVRVRVKKTVWKDRRHNVRTVELTHEFVERVRSGHVDAGIYPKIPHRACDQEHSVNRYFLAIAVIAA